MQKCLDFFPWNFKSWNHSQSSEWLFWIFLDQSRCVTLFEVNLEGGWNDMWEGENVSCLVVRCSDYPSTWNWSWFCCLMEWDDFSTYMWDIRRATLHDEHILQTTWRTSYWTNIYVIYHDFLNTTGFFPRWKTTARRWKKVRPQASHICRARKVCQTLPRWWARSLGEADRPWIFWVVQWWGEKDHIWICIIWLYDTCTYNSV